MAGGDFLAVRIDGIDDLAASMRAVGAIGSKQALTSSMLKAVKPIVVDANLTAPVGEPPESAGDKPLKGSYVARVRLSKSQMRKRGGRYHPVEVFVGSTARHAHLVEFGHRMVVSTSETEWVLRGRRRRRETEGRTRGQFVPLDAAGTLEDLRAFKEERVKRQVGHVSAHPVLRPAFDRQHKKVMDIFFRDIGQSVARVAKRYRRQAERGKLSKGARVAYSVPL